MKADSEKTMKNLRVKVAGLLRETLHGKTVDMMQTVKPRLPHMLGYTEIGKVHDPKNEEGTLMRSRCEWWDDYYKEVETINQAIEEVTMAIETLREDELFRMNYPYGEEGGIIYVEVDDPEQYSFASPQQTYKLPCENCDQTLRTSPRLVLNSGYCDLKVLVECEKCGFSRTYSRKLIRE